MDIFIRQLFDAEDFRSLTLRIIREKYEREINAELTFEQKKLLKETVDIIFMEKIKNDVPIGKNVLKMETSIIGSNKRKWKHVESSDDDGHLPIEKDVREECDSLKSLKTVRKKRKQILSSEDDDDAKDSLMARKITKNCGKKSEHLQVKREHNSTNDYEHGNEKDDEMELKFITGMEEPTQESTFALVANKEGSQDDSDRSGKEIHKDINESSNDDIDDNTRKGKQKKKSYKKKDSKVNKQEKSKQLKHYEKIARECGVMPVGTRYKATFGSCSSEAERIQKLKQILRDAGMKGRISMEEAEKLKLKREAAELGLDNIINSSAGRSRRNIFYFHKHNEYNQVSKGQSVIGIVDSDSE